MKTKRLPPKNSPAWVVWGFPQAARREFRHVAENNGLTVAGLLLPLVERFVADVRGGGNSSRSIIDAAQKR